MCNPDGSGPQLRKAGGLGKTVMRAGNPAGVGGGSAGRTTQGGYIQQVGGANPGTATGSVSASPAAARNRQRQNQTILGGGLAATGAVKTTLGA